MKTKPTLEIENKLKAEGYKYIIGIDEAGRGPGAGPVVAAGVNIPDGFNISEINDSKKLTVKKRDSLFEIITNECPYGFSMIDNNLIDAINILEATKLAMRNVIYQMNEATVALIDGNFTVNNVDIEQMSLIRGDSRSASIAAASIIGKVIRDRHMDKLHKIYPIYGWDKNKGYLTKEHIEAIQTYGPCEYHRKTFGKVKEYV